MGYRDAVDSAGPRPKNSWRNLEDVPQYERRQGGLGHRARNFFSSPRPCPRCRVGDYEITWGVICMSGLVGINYSYGCSLCDARWRGDKFIN